MYQKKSILSAFVGVFAAALLQSTVTAAVLLADHDCNHQCDHHCNHDHDDGFHSVIYEGNNPQALGEFSAATVTNNEAGLEAIFDANFGVGIIDIRFNAIKTLTNATLLNIDTPALLTTLLSNHPVSDGSPTVNMFFVDTIDECGGFNPSIVGCAFTPGNDMVVESSFAAGASGPELQAHELGHNLGLGHIVEVNLMSGSLNGNTDLSTSVTEADGGATVNQITAVLGSSLVQTESGTGQRYIEITPILVQAAPVPEPTAVAFLGLAGLFLIGRRKR